MRLPKHLSDQELINEYRNDNIDAFNVLVLRYKDQLYTAIYLLVKNKQLAEDIFQEVFVRAINSIRSDRYKETGMFLAWLIRIAHNMYLDHLRKEKRTDATRPVDNYDTETELAALTDGADHRIIEEQKLKTISQLIDLLPKEQQEIIILRHYANLSFKEIAAVMNISINTALGRIRYALMNLRRIIEKRTLLFEVSSYQLLSFLIILPMFLTEFLANIASHF